MQIKSVEALKSWLTTRLESVCDADPAALAKYVVALVKKDKPVEELKEICVDQLEVFLSSETGNFVNMLFDALTNSSYIPQTIVEPVQVVAVPTTPKVTTSQPTPANMNSTTPPEKPRKPSISEDVLTPRVLAESSVLDDDDRDFKRTRRTTDSSDRSSGGSSSVVSSSGDRSRKRRADDDVRGRGDFAKFPKDESGVMRRGDSEPRDENATYPIPSAMQQRDRGMKYMDSQDGRNSHDDSRRRRGSPSWDRRGGRMGRGRPYRDRYRDELPRHGARDERERSGSRKSRCRDYDEKGFCMRGELCPFDHGNDPVVVQDVLPTGMLGFPDGQPIPVTTLPGTAGPIPGGFPVPTSQPPPPGTTGVLPNDAPKTDAKQKGPDTTVPVSGPRPSAPARMVRPQHSQAPVMPLPTVHMMQPPMLRGQAPRPPFGNPFEDSYNPEQPQFDRTPVWMRLGNGRPPHPIPPRGVFHPAMGMRARELLPVTPNAAQLTVQVPGMTAPGPRMPPIPDRIVMHSEPQQNTPALPQEQPPPPQQAPVVPKQGVTQTPAAINQTAPVKSQLGFPRKLSDTLELKKIPRDFNNIAKLNEHFQRFGNITNIQVCAFGDPEAALVQFSHHTEAKAAYSCPDAVLGNRFIRVFWYNPDWHQNNKAGNSNQGATTSGDSGSVTPSEPAAKENNKPNAEPKAKPTMFQSGKTTFSKNAKTTPVHIPANPALTKRQQELSKQEAMKKKLEIQKQKQELLNKQIKEQKLLISKLEKKNLSVAEKELVMKTIKSLSSNIESLKKEVELAAMTAKSKESPSQARQIAQKAILDQELDLITHQNTGEDTTELKKKVEELKQEAKSLGLLDPPTKGRGRGAVRGRGRGIPVRSRPLPRTTRVWTRESASLDHRPKQITVIEITPEQREDTSEHFREFGIVDSEEYIEDKNTLNLTFRTRKEAEIAYNKGKTFKGRALKISWYRPPAPVGAATVTTPTTPTTPTALKKVEEEFGLDIDELGKHEFDPETEEALLLGEDFDEEEEEEDERSWKR